MFNTNPVQLIQQYANEAEAQWKQLPSEAQIQQGVLPLDSLPAQWWNAMWGQITEQERNTVSAINHLMTEIVNVLGEAAITPSIASDSQLLLAITTLIDNARKIIATTSRIGGVMASDQVAVASDGTMSTPQVGDLAELTEKANTIVAAINAHTEAIRNISVNAGLVVEITEITGKSTFHDWADLRITYDPQKTYLAVAHVRGNYPNYMPIGVVVSEEGITLYANHIDDGKVVAGTPHKLWGVDKWGQGIWDAWSTLPVILQVSAV